MIKLYIDRLIAIREMLESPHAEVLQDAYELLFNLWQENANDPDFNEELRQLIVRYPKLPVELEKHLQKLPKDAENKKNISSLKKSLKSLTPETPIITADKPNEPIGESTGNILPPESEPNAQISKSNRSLEIQLGSKKLTLKPRYVILAILGVLLSIWMWYVLQSNGPVNWEIAPNVNITYSYPKYLSVGDQNTVDVNIVNSNALEFDGTITLIFHDPTVPITPVADQSLSADLAIPPHQGRQAKQFNFLLTKKPYNANIKFFFQVSHPDGTIYKSSDESFLVAPLPYLRSAWGWVISSSGVVAFIVALLWDQIKKLIDITN